MNKEIIEIDAKQGIFRVTTTDERWYTSPGKNQGTGLPEYQFIPSVTWISSHYPKGVAFYKWLSGTGWDESQALKNAGGNRGSKVHKAIENLVAGEVVRMNDKYKNNSTGNEEELTVEEYQAIMSFANWANKVKPKFLSSEITVVSKEYGYAGTVDCVAEIDGQVWIIDWKTSQNIWPEMEIQISAYKNALCEMKKTTKDVKLAVLQVGYKRNKNYYKFTEIDDQFELFLAARSIWKKEASGQHPSQKDYPMNVSLGYIQEHKKAKKSKA